VRRRVGGVAGGGGEQELGFAYRHAVPGGERAFLRGEAVHFDTGGRLEIEQREAPAGEGLDAAMAVGERRLGKDYVGFRIAAEAQRGSLVEIPGLTGERTGDGDQAGRHSSFECINGGREPAGSRA
jgi:hypothetical protein